MPSFAKAALAAYSSGHRLLLRKGDLSDLAPETVDALLAASLLVHRDEDTFRFAHQLHHDYLAALAVAKSGGPWDDDVFDALSLKAASPDPLVLLAELTEADRVDDLVRSVYD